MRRAYQLLLVAMIFTSGCSRYLNTREIVFYREGDVNGGLPVAVDVVYPRDLEERNKIIRDIGPTAWFTSDLAQKVVKDKEDVTAGPATSIKLSQKPTKELGLVIIAEYGKRAENSAVQSGEEAIIFLDQNSVPKPRKRERIKIHPGFMKRHEIKSGSSSPGGDEEKKDDKKDEKKDDEKEEKKE